MNSAADNVDKYRAIITGTFITRSFCHFGDGAIAELQRDAESDANQDKDKSVAVQGLCRDGQGLPYIPANTLKGFLRDALENRVLTKELKAILVTLLGSANAPAAKKTQQKSGAAGSSEDTAERSVSDENNGQAGELIISDAYCSDSAPFAAQERTRVSIDPITNTAADHLLFGEELISVGTTFAGEFRTGWLSLDEIDLLRELFHLWDGAAASAMGKGKSSGYGRIEWQESEVRLLSSQDFKAWLTEASCNRTLECAYKEHAHFTQKSLEVTSPQTLKVKIISESPLLISTGEKASEDDDVALTCYRQSDGRVLIPGSSLKGMIRAHARKILCTMGDRTGMSMKVVDAAVDHLLGQIFGSEKQAALISVSDAVSDKPVTPFKQTFNAVDRFTGGVDAQSGALFSVNAAPPCSMYASLVVSRSPSATDAWMTGLAVLLLRDAVEGDLSVGWGKAKGYGAIRVALGTEDQDGNKMNYVERWEKLLDGNKEQWMAAVEALEKKLQDDITGKSSEGKLEKGHE